MNLHNGLLLETFLMRTHHLHFFLYINNSFTTADNNRSGQQKIIISLKHHFLFNFPSILYHNIIIIIETSNEQTFIQYNIYNKHIYTNLSLIYHYYKQDTKHYRTICERQYYISFYLLWLESVKQTYNNIHTIQIHNTYYVQNT